jgi:hypothetical protein
MPILYRTDLPATADVKVYLTTIRSDADVVFFVASNRWEATATAVWYWTDVSSEASKIVCLVASQWEADLTAYQTEVASDAGWPNAGKEGFLA